LRQAWHNVVVQVLLISLLEVLIRLPHAAVDVLLRGLFRLPHGAVDVLLPNILRALVETTILKKQKLASYLAGTLLPHRAKT
jgi:hypothetical protein